MKVFSADRIRSLTTLAVCATLLMVATIAWAQDKQERVRVDNIERNFVVHLPRGYEATGHYPVVLVLSGRRQDTEDIAQLTRFNELADQYNVITVYPEPYQGRWNIGVPPEPPKSQNPGMGRGGGRRGSIWFPGGGGMGGPGNTGDQGGRRRQPTGPQADDLAFFNSMLDKLSASYPVDATRIYATGLSDGGFMDFRLGCRMADRIAAIAPVAAAMPKNLTCVPSRLMPVLMINGTSDPIVPYKGGAGKPGSYATISVEESAKTWATLNNCQDKPQRTTLPPQSKGGKKTAVDTYSCKQDTVVSLYSLKDAGNTWPGGAQYMSNSEVGKTSTDLNATDVIWKFFSTHTLPAPPAATPASASEPQQ